jgi:Uncharacterized conserved protein
MNEVLEFLKQNPVFYFATVEGDQPRVRPFGFFMEHEGKLYFGLGNQKESYKQLVKNPKFEISTASKEGQWIRIRGKAVFDERPEVTEKAFSIMPHLRGMYSAENGPRLALLYVSEGEAVIADFQGNDKTYKL